MQRRSFLRNAACVGASASLLMPVAQVFAQAPSEEIALRLQRIAGAQPTADAGGVVQLRVAPRLLAAQSAPLRVRAWFATDAGAQAFDLASFGAAGSSQRLRLVADTRRLIGFEAASGRVHDDCIATAACGATSGLDGSLSPGSYCLILSRGGHEFAAIDIDVGTVAA